MVEVKSIGINKEYSYELTKPISFSEDIIKMVNLGKLSSDAIGLYCITEEIKLLKEEIKKLKEEKECQKNLGDISSV